jgi:hypothetical protein
MKTGETVLIVGGVVIAGALVYMALKAQAANTESALNQPGLETAPSVPVTAGGILGSILSSGTGALGGGLSTLADAFGSTTDTNDPGLETDDSTDFSGMDYTGSNSDPYGILDDEED